MCVSIAAHFVGRCSRSFLDRSGGLRASSMAESSAVVVHGGLSEGFTCEARLLSTHAGQYELEWLSEGCPTAKTSNKDGIIG